MKFAEGTCGRIFYLHIEHGEDPGAVITSFVKEHNIRSGVIHLIGAVKGGRMVVGPKEERLPHEPIWAPVDGPHELIGTAFIRTGQSGPAIHLHASVGRGEETLTGCLRGKSEVFIIIEAVIIEFAGIELPMSHDSITGLSLPIPKTHNSGP